MEDDNNTASKLIEIKEILERVKKHYVLDEIQDNLLLDYITNLQQELETRQYDINNLTYQLAKEKEEKEDYKSRCEKADWYLSESLECLYHGANFTFDELIHNTSDILNGRSDE